MVGKDSVHSRSLVANLELTSLSLPKRGARGHSPSLGQDMRFVFFITGLVLRFVWVQYLIHRIASNLLVDLTLVLLLLGATA